MRFRQRLLKLFTPRAEEARMSMREARCRAEASADDLSRTMSLHSEDIVRMLREQAKVNGKGNGKGNGK